MHPRFEGEPPLKKILFCTDFSENADLAFAFAAGAAARHPGSVLILLHVIPEPDAQFWKTYVYEVDGVDAKAKRDIDAKVQESYRSRLPAEVAVKVVMRVGRDSAEILSYAEEEGVDLIVMGRQGSNRLGKVLFGNVTETVARKARCPVLIVPYSARGRLAGVPAADQP